DSAIGPSVEVSPSIDIKDGRCVRLYQGDYHKLTVYDEDPRRVARRWEGLGAATLHLVDLDGAASGTAAVREPTMVDEAIARWGDRVVLGVDARDGRAATHGWRETSAVDAYELARRFASRGVRRVIYTDVSRDGTLTEPNYAAMAEMVTAAAPAVVIASGGVGTLEHVKKLADTGVAGVVVGRAL